MLFTILSLPIDGFNFVLKTLIKVAEEQYTDDAPLKQQLLELQVRLENGDISEDQYVEAEGDILRGIREIQRRKIEMAGGDPDEFSQGIHGNLAEGSGASLSVDFSPGGRASDQEEE